MAGAASAQQRLAYDLATVPAQSGAIVLQGLTRVGEALLCAGLGKVALEGLSMTLGPVLRCGSR